MSTTEIKNIFTKDLVSPKAGNRILLVLLALTVAGGIFYINGTARMQSEQRLNDMYVLSVSSRHLPEKIKAGKALGLTATQVVQSDFALFKKTHQNQ
ncbi:TPA: hypothetical protein ACK3Q6_002684 [Burkholderia cepacia]|uniref:Uncharacterized protein n=1 Tax=Burkholderia cenocepacia TaxID=95486 RepID=A0ABD4UCL0_9BURK|nr:MULTISPECIES: hypothetical protein [Burkholderia cepacia complex]HDR9764256.1 hypothetical protein [Burkholderia cepacia ATCC 25416]MCA8361207.1 hypothetical protein [Burkholderia cepacia]MCW3696288.1 hypothetical protein [Burkholderia cenocepacia]MCW3704493.1 hypothetical protein [Burkholderia cenocepacia]MCW3712068.1 hypothetical protein [Burkholderia cenocepacia]